MKKARDIVKKKKKKKIEIQGKSKFVASAASSNKIADDLLT